MSLRRNSMSPSWRAWALPCAFLHVGCPGHPGSLDAVRSDQIGPHEVGDQALDGEAMFGDSAEVDGLPGPDCGDGVLDPGEECDDGNRLNGDECDWACRFGPGDPPTRTPDESIEGSASVELVRLPASPGSLPSMGFPGLHSGRIPLVWDGAKYATVLLDATYARDDFRSTEAVVSSDAVFVEFDTDGRMVGPGWRYHEPGRPFSGLDLASGGEGYGLVWCGLEGALMFLALDESGKPVAEPVELVAGIGACRPQIEWDREAFVIVWTIIEDRPEPNGGPDLGFVRATGRGSRLVGPTSLYDAGASIGWPSLAVAEGRLLVAFADWAWEGCDPATCSGCLRYVVADTAGQVLRTSFLVSPMIRSGPDATAVPGGFGVVWYAPGTTVRPDGVHLGLVDLFGAMTDPPRAIEGCDRGRCHASSQAVAWGREGFGILGSRGDIWFVRTDRVGVTTDVRELTGGSYPLNINLAFDGEGFGAIGLGSSVVEPPYVFWRYRLVAAAE